MPFRSSSGSLDPVTSIQNSDNNGFANFKTSGITLANLLSNSEKINDFNDIGSGSSRNNGAWSNGTNSYDSGIRGHSPPFDNILKSAGSSGQASNQQEPTLNGIWGELNKMLGGLDINSASPDMWPGQQERQQRDEVELSRQNVSNI